MDNWKCEGWYNSLNWKEIITVCRIKILPLWFHKHSTVLICKVNRHGSYTTHLVDHNPCVKAKSRPMRCYAFIILPHTHTHTYLDGAHQAVYSTTEQHWNLICSYQHCELSADPWGDWPTGKTQIRPDGQSTSQCENGRVDIVGLCNVCPGGVTERS